MKDIGVITPAKLRNAAMDLLTGREFSRAELRSKLSKRFENHSGIDDVLDQLCDDGLQSDSRFTNAFVRSRVSRGQGLARIRMDIREKGIDQELLTRILSEQEVDWFELARDVAQRKFGNEEAKDQKAKAKRVRFLQYRGFNFDQIKYALAVEVID
jgi:regulatory protein